MPSVRSGTPISRKSACCWRTPLQRPGHEIDEPPPVMIHPVTAGYFRVLGVPVIAGRELNDQEVEKPTPIVLSKTAAREIFGDTEAVGEIVRNQREQKLTISIGKRPRLQARAN